MEKNFISTISLVSLFLVLSLKAGENSKQMAEIIALKNNNAPASIGPFSQAIKVKNVQETVYISGQLPIIPETNELITDPAEATKQCMRNLAAILEAADMDFSNVVETIIFLKDMADFSVVNTAYASFLQSPYPARATFQVAGLPKNACVEIKMVAVK